MSSLEIDAIQPILEHEHEKLPISIQCLCQSQCERGARLYIFSGGLRAVITVLTGQGNCVMIDDLSSVDPVPEWLSSRTGRVDMSPEESVAFFEQLESLSIRDRGDCITNSREGLFAVLVMADRHTEICVRMLNPNIHDDPVYKDAVNLFSKTFLGGSLLL